MNEHAIPKGFLRRMARTFLVGLALVYALKLIGQMLSFGDTAYAIGFVIVTILTTLTNRTDFYNPGPYLLDPPERPSRRGPPRG